ncbi:MAG: site-specific DNA-methyltransferase [Thiobacillus sp.]|nr:site-specific DNA-methyltransferase [Thiobacillus sp.]
MGLYVSFESWTRKRKIVSIGTNTGAEKLPFQDWHHFKEAFTPEIIARAASECGHSVHTCIDPFGGSGTTALACQFLGISPTTIEVNPYLADLIEAKLQSYDADDLALDLSRIVRATSGRCGRLERFTGLPPTFIEAEGMERWVFDAAIAERIACHLDAIEALERPHHQRLFRILLGGMLIAVSNVVVNGKGRRYRGSWRSRETQPRSVDELFQSRAQNAITEIHQYRFRRHCGYTLLRGDCLTQIPQALGADLAVFSPPYPNSFDYTDVYNVELWMLGYLSSPDSNRVLRTSTLCSHVQIKRDFGPPPTGSRRLSLALGKLRKVRTELWSPWIPDMVGGYFHDMQKALSLLHGKLNTCGELWAVVGDSRYAGVRIPVAAILADLAPVLGYRVLKLEPFRSMRSSAQQGGRCELDETLLVLQKNT